MISRPLANGLTVAGIALVLAALTLIAYTILARSLAEAEFGRIDAIGAAPASSQAVQAPAAGPDPAKEDSQKSGNLDARVVAGPASRLLIPAIGVDARVVEATVKGDSWLVPKFAAGHLEGTAQPGQGRNVVMVGHVDSISAGDVFARLADLEPGDRITVRTAKGEIRYVVRQLRTVKPTDLEVVAPGQAESLTLVTCTGTWNPVSREYSHRLIAVADPVAFTPN